MSIPTKLFAIVRPAITKASPHRGRLYTASPAYVVPADSVKMVASAREWGTGDRYIRSVGISTGTPEEVSLDNDPLTRLQLVDWEYRGEGGRAYKVLTDQGWLVDFREDEFHEAVFNGRIDGAGLIFGNYVWSQASGQMRLVLVGSDLYNQRLTKNKV